MEVDSFVGNDDVLLLENNTSVVPTRRVWPYVGAFALVAAAGAAGHVAIHSGDVADSVSLHGYPWIPAWHSRPLRFDQNGCTWDGDDCRSSRCCAQEGSSCYVKNYHWASCNETCHYNVRWEGGEDRRGHWVVQNHPVWECRDITLHRVVKAEPTTPKPKPVETPAPETPAPVKVIVHETPHDKFSIYEDRPDYKAVEYGEREQPEAVRDAASTNAPTVFVDDKFAGYEETPAR